MIKLRVTIRLMLVVCFSLLSGIHQAFAQDIEDFNPSNPAEPGAIDFCRLVVSADPAEGAYVSGGGKYLVNGNSVYVSTSARNTGDYTYTFLYWTLNGEKTSYDQSFWFTPQNGKYELIAHYEKKEVVFDPSNPAEPSMSDIKRKYYLYLTSNLEGAGSFNIASGNKYEEQSRINVCIYLNAGYRFDGWKLNGEIISTSTSCYLNMPSVNSTLEACVTELPFDPENPMEPISNIPIIRGDVNGDGEVDTDDATFVTNIIIGIEDATEEADVNKDGEIGMPDVMFIVNYIKNGKFPDE